MRTGLETIQHGLASKNEYSKLRVIRIQSDLKNNSVYAEIRLTSRKCIGFGQFDQKFCSDYAIIWITRIRIMRSSLFSLKIRKYFERNASDTIAMKMRSGVFNFFRVAMKKCVRFFSFVLRSWIF